MADTGPENNLSKERWAVNTPVNRAVCNIQRKATGFQWRLDLGVLKHRRLIARVSLAGLIGDGGFGYASGRKYVTQAKTKTAVL
jgi:hypothetical protein